MSRTATAFNAALLLASASLPNAVLGKQRSFLASSQDLQPQVVARTLVKVEAEWKDQAAAFVMCDAEFPGSDSCQKSSQAFIHSCGTVVQAMLSASSGDRDDLQDYLKDVCGQEELIGWRQEECKAMSAAVLVAMSVDSYENRQDFDSSSPCQGFWHKFVDDEKSRTKELDARHTVERKAEEQRLEKVKKAQQQRDEKKNAAAQAAEKVVVAKHEEEEREEKQIEARRKAAEAKAKKLAEKAAARHEEAMRKEDEVNKLLAETRKVVQEAKEVPKYTVGISSEPWISNSSTAVHMAAAPTNKVLATNTKTLVNSTASSNSTKGAS